MYHTLRDILSGIYGALDLVIVESVLHFLSSNELFSFRLLAIVLFLYLPIPFVSWATMLALIGEISLWQFIAPLKQVS